MRACCVTSEDVCRPRLHARRRRSDCCHSGFTGTIIRTRSVRAENGAGPGAATRYSLSTPGMGIGRSSCRSRRASAAAAGAHLPLLHRASGRADGARAPHGLRRPAAVGGAAPGRRRRRSGKCPSPRYRWRRGEGTAAVTRPGRCRCRSTSPTAPQFTCVSGNRPRRRPRRRSPS